MDHPLVVGVVGTGDMLPKLASPFVTAGLRVVAFDLDVSPGRAGAVPGGEVTADRSRLGEPDVVLIGTPVTVTGAYGADTAAVAVTAREVAGGLRRGQLVVLTGVVPPGTTRGVLLPPLVATGLLPERDFFLAYVTAPSSTTGRRVIGGLGKASAGPADELFTRAGFDAMQVSSLEVAEVCGAVDAMDRTVRAAVADELRVACGRMGLDAWEVMAAAGIPLLGPNSGGEPAALLLAWGARRCGAPLNLLDAAVAVAAAMPRHVIGKVADALNDVGKAVRGSKIAVLGMACHAGAEDQRESPGLELLRRLWEKGASVSYNDPHPPRLPPTRHRSLPEPLTSQPLTAHYLAAQDCVLIAVDRAAYDYNLIVRHSRLVLDTRDATKSVTEGRAKIVRV